MNLIQEAIGKYNDSIVRIFPDEKPVFSPKAVLFDMDGVLYDSMPTLPKVHEALRQSCAM